MWWVIVVSGESDTEPTKPSDPFKLLREIRRVQAQPAPPAPAEPDVREVAPMFRADLGPLDEDARYELSRALRDVAARTGSGSIGTKNPVVEALRELAAAVRVEGPVKLRVRALDRTQREVMHRVLMIALSNNETGSGGPGAAAGHLKVLVDQWERFVYGRQGYTPAIAVERHGQPQSPMRWVG